MKISTSLCEISTSLKFHQNGLKKIQEDKNFTIFCKNLIKKSDATLQLAKTEYGVVQKYANRVALKNASFVATITPLLLEYAQSNKPGFRQPPIACTQKKTA